ncbi:hypothetical protein B0H21DRAFT_189960 [Amylocystis lapponica]|nr:hypothetical protein B0H21DRAFT_189960 [Amylocystis lapponica]
MSKPAIIPDTTTAGIALDPRTLERVIPESRRPDGSVRKQIKIRPGFTPQEDVRRFRSTRQAEMDARALPKGHVVGWAPPSAAAPALKGPLSKNAKKHEKKKEKKKEKRDEAVRESWEDEDEDEVKEKEKAGAARQEDAGGEAEDAKGAHSPEAPNWAAAPETKESAAVRQKAQSAQAEDLSAELAKLEVR